MTERTALTPHHPSVTTAIGGSGTAETAPVDVKVGDSLVVDIFTTAAGVRVAHGSAGIDATTGYPLVAGSRNTIVIKRGDILAYAGTNGDVVIYTVLT
ncbi:hypothetical protein [Labrenzia sp. DG1229]|uniref:hypothetical protein n=1 Tax=Labrenzia sp. DG1229 TaxID=681847 RepID=UPI000490DE19|nr:hypothetical protein [Labrenzia sp. DG1229]